MSESYVPNSRDRVIHLSEQTGELTTLGADEVDGWIEPDIIPPPPGGWPEGSWGGGGPGGWGGGWNGGIYPPPDWGVNPYVPPEFDPGESTPVPEPPVWEPPPDPGPGEEPPVDPGYNGFYENITGPVLAWDSRSPRDGVGVPLSGTGAPAAETRYYGSLSEILTPQYDDSILSAEWNGQSWSASEGDWNGRRWSSGVYGGALHGSPFTYVVALRPGDLRGSSVMQIGAAGVSMPPYEPGLRLSVNSSAQFSYSIPSGVTSTRQLVEIEVIYRSYGSESDLTQQPILPPFPYPPMAGENSVFAAGAQGWVRAPSQINVVVFSVQLPTGTPQVWLNQQPLETIAQRSSLYFVDEWSRPDYTTEPGVTDNTGLTGTLRSGLFGSGPEPAGGTPTGAAVQAMFRGVPNANDLAVLQWRYGQ
jgi:hypothetical protein